MEQAEREARLQIEKARFHVELEAINLQREVAAVIAKAKTFEGAAEREDGYPMPTGTKRCWNQQRRERARQTAQPVHLSRTRLLTHCSTTETGSPHGNLQMTMTSQSINAMEGSHQRLRGSYYPSRWRVFLFWGHARIWDSMLTH